MGHGLLRFDQTPFCDRVTDAAVTSGEKPLWLFHPQSENTGTQKTTKGLMCYTDDSLFTHHDECDHTHSMPHPLTHLPHHTPRKKKGLLKVLKVLYTPQLPPPRGFQTKQILRQVPLFLLDRPRSALRNLLPPPEMDRTTPHRDGPGWHGLRRLSPALALRSIQKVTTETDYCYR